MAEPFFCLGCIDDANCSCKTLFAPRMRRSNSGRPPVPIAPYNRPLVPQEDVTIQAGIYSDLAETQVINPGT
jgi:hypothetical protein